VASRQAHRRGDVDLDGAVQSTHRSSKITLGGQKPLDPVVVEAVLAEDLPGVLPDDGRRAVGHRGCRREADRGAELLEAAESTGC